MASTRQEARPARKEDDDKRLEEALKLTFPASDPIAVNSRPEPIGTGWDRDDERSGERGASAGGAVSSPATGKPGSSRMREPVVAVAP